MAKDNSERQREWRAKKREKGFKMVTVWLTPENAQKLDELVKDSGLPKQAARTELINELIAKNK
jgi:hypothetical protein